MADAQREQLNGIKKAFMKFLQAESMESSFVVAGRPISIWDLWLAARTFEMTISQQIDHPSKFHFVGAQLGLPTDPQTGQISSQSLHELQKRHIQLITVIKNARDLSNRHIPLPQTNANKSHPEKNISMLHGTIYLYSHVDFSGVSRDAVANLSNYQFETRLRSYISDWNRVFNNKQEAGDTPDKKLQTAVPGLVIMNNPRIPTTAGNEQAHEPTRNLTTLQERTHERSLRAKINDSETEAEFLSLPISANTTNPIIQSSTSTLASVPQITALESALTGNDDDDASRKTIESLQNHPKIQALLSVPREIQRDVIARLENRLDEYDQVILHLQAENRHPEAAECMARRHKWRLLIFVLIHRESLAQEARSQDFIMTIGSVINSYTLQNRFRWRGSLIITDAEGNTYPELLILLETMRPSPRMQADALAAWPRRISVTPIKQLSTPDGFNNWVERSKPEEMFALTPEVENWPDSQRTPEILRAIQESMKGFSLAHHTVFMGGVVLHGVINLATGGTDNLILFPAIVTTTRGHVPPQPRILVARYSSPPNLATLPGVSFSIPASLPSDPAPPATPQSTLPTAGANSDLESRLNNEGVESNKMDPGPPRPILLTSSYWTAGDRERIVALIEAHGDDYKAIAANLSLKSHNQVKNYIKGRRNLCEVLNRVLLEKARHHT